MSPERSLKHFVTHVKEISHFRKTWSSFKRYPLETTPYVKLFIWDDDENKLKKLRHSVPENLNVHVTDSGSNNIEIIPNSCSKYKMILHLAESMGIEQTGIASIGDSNNDLEMLVHSKLGIAMGNSPNEIKKIAKWVTSSNREDGVAYAIEYILNSYK